MCPAQAWCDHADCWHCAPREAARPDGRVPNRERTCLRLVAIRVSASASIGAGAAQQAVQLHRVVTQTQCQRSHRLRVGRDRRAAPREAGVAAGRRRQGQQPRRHGPLLQPRRRRERAEVGASPIQ